MSNNEFTTKEEQPSQALAQPQKAVPRTKWAQNAMHPEKVLLQIWGLLALGIAIRVISPMLATGGVIFISGTAVLTVMIFPALLAGMTFYYNRKGLTDLGRALLIGSAAVTTAFGIYLLAWAVS